MRVTAKKMRRLGSAGESGFTLIEMLMAIAIVSILFGTVYGTFTNLNRSYTAETVKAGVQQKTRIGVEFMVRDIRLAGLDPLGSASAGFISATQNSIQFTADMNYDGDLNDPFEIITYALNGSELEQTTADLGTETLMDRVADLNFSYLDADENDLMNHAMSPPQVPANELADIRTVVISLTTQRPAGKDGPVSRTYSTRVRCRNL